MTAQTTDKRLTQLESYTALRAIARSLSEANDLDATLDLIARKTTEVMGVDSCTIYLLDSDNETLRLRASTGLAAAALGRATLRVGEGMTGHAVALNQPVHAADAQHDPHFKWVDDTREVRFSSLLAVPLVLNNAAIGALNVQTRSAHDYANREIEALSFVSDLAAVALHRARLYDRQRRQLEELKSLTDVSEAITSPQYLDDILEVVTETAARAVSAENCTIYLHEEHSDEPGGPEPAPRPAGHAPYVALTDETWQQILQAGQAVRRTLPGAGLEDIDNIVLAVPLSVQDRVIGAMVCLLAGQQHGDESRENLLTALANQTALAIENARLVTNAAVVREMHHRIKNNLQTIVMLMQLQLAEADKLDARQVLQANVHRIRSIAAVHEILSEKGFRLVDVRSVLERIVQITLTGLTRPQQQIAINIHGENLQLPSRAATAVCVAVNELVQNSLEHAFEDRPAGQIDISIGRSPEHLIFVVRDDGTGLPDSINRHLGLEIAESLVVSDWNGSFEIARLPQGTEAVIRLPRHIEQLPPLGD